MEKTTYYEKEKRLEKLSKEDILDLTFDLINAFGRVRSSAEAANLIKDLLTADEIKDLAKRLRIAKLLTKGESQREIARVLHCSLATVTKVSIWVQNSDNSLKNVIEKLPVKYNMPKNIPKGPIEFHMPQYLLSTAQALLSQSQTAKTKKFIEKVEEKRSSDKILQESLRVEYQNLKKVHR